MSDMLRMVAMMMSRQASGPVTYATWNSADNGGNSLSGGNLIVSSGGSKGTRATIGKTSDKWYWEVNKTGGGSESDIGIATSSYNLSTWLGADAQGLGYDSSDGKVYKNGAVVASYATYTAGDVIGFALDYAAGTIAFYKNNTLQGTISHGLSGTIYPAIGDFAVGVTSTANFGATALTYTPPSGFNAGMYN